MTIWYNMVDTLLPFEFMHHIFMKNALLGIILVTPVFGILGTMIVNNKMAFFSDAIGHSALTGIAIGVILGIKAPLFSMIVFSLFLSVAILMVKNANTASPDTVIGVFSSTAVALGVVILSNRGGFTKYSSYLIGDLLSISSTDIALLILVLLVVIILWVTVFNKLLLVSVNNSLARSRGINVKLYEYIFGMVMAVVVTISIQWVGILIISSLLVLPAAAARNIARNIRQYHLIAVLIAIVSGITGLLFSYYFDTATGATIVLVSSIFFAATFLIKLTKNI